MIQPFIRFTEGTEYIDLCIAVLASIAQGAHFPLLSYLLVELFLALIESDTDSLHDLMDKDVYILTALAGSMFLVSMVRSIYWARFSRSQMKKLRVKCL